MLLNPNKYGFANFAPSVKVLEGGQYRRTTEDKYYQQKLANKKLRRQASGDLVGTEGLNSIRDVQATKSTAQLTKGESQRVRNATRSRVDKRVRGRTERHTPKQLESINYLADPKNKTPAELRKLVNAAASGDVSAVNALRGRYDEVARESAHLNNVAESTRSASRNTKKPPKAARSRADRYSLALEKMNALDSGSATIHDLNERTPSIPLAGSSPVLPTAGMKKEVINSANQAAASGWGTKQLAAGWDTVRGHARAGWDNLPKRKVGIGAAVAGLGALGYAGKKVLDNRARQRQLDEDYQAWQADPKNWAAHPQQAKYVRKYESTHFSGDSYV
jgi:hypothetical protein